MDNTLLEISQIPDIELRYNAYSHYITTHGDTLGDVQNGIKRIIGRDHQNGEAFYENKNIPKLLKTMIIISPNDIRWNYLSNDAMSQVLNGILQQDINVGYYMALHSLKSIGKGAYGSVSTTSIMRDIDQYSFITQAYAHLTGDKWPEGYTYTSPVKNLAIKALSSFDPDPAILNQLKTVRMWAGWFIPSYYATINNQPIPRNFDVSNSTSENKDWDTLLFFEYINAKSVANTALSDENKIKLELVCHSVMLALYQAIGFRHNDIHGNNILLIETKCSLPIYDSTRPFSVEEGPYVIGVVDCDYCPVMVDFSQSMTNKYQFWTTFINPYTGQERDAMTLYLSFDGVAGSAPKEQWEATYKYPLSPSAVQNNMLQDTKSGLDHAYMINLLLPHVTLRDDLPNIPTRTAVYASEISDPQWRTAFLSFLLETRSTIEAVEDTSEAIVVIKQYFRNLYSLYLD